MTNMTNPIAIWQQVDAARYRFIGVETDLGLTFARAAIGAHSTDECLHDRQLARKAYDTAAKIMTTSVLAGRQAATLRRKLQLLKDLLGRLGDPQCTIWTTRSCNQSSVRDNRLQF
jgi:hypothetical protein